MMDDDPILTKLYSSVFRINKINLPIAKNGTDGLQKAEEEKPNLILLAIMLPDINGFDVFKNLKQDPRTNKIAVWILSNPAERLNKDAARSLGADGYLVKARSTPNQLLKR